MKEKNKMAEINIPKQIRKEVLKIMREKVINLFEEKLSEKRKEEVKNLFVIISDIFKILNKLQNNFNEENSSSLEEMYIAVKLSEKWSIKKNDELPNFGNLDKKIIEEIFKEDFNDKTLECLLNKVLNEEDLVLSLLITTVFFTNDLIALAKKNNIIDNKYVDGLWNNSLNKVKVCLDNIKNRMN